MDLHNALLAVQGVYDKPLCETCYEMKTISYHEEKDCPIHREEYRHKLTEAEEALDRAWERNR